MTPPRPIPLVCEVGAFPADVAAVDSLARLQLSARRLGLEIHLRGASSELLELLVFAGLRRALCVEAGRQAEEGEEAAGVEEEGELDDAPA